MRILNVRLENYRTHRELNTPFDHGITLVHGPNESGKSTLVEAIHRGLFLKAKGTSELHKSMAPTDGGTPIVELTIEVGGANFLLTKKFSGTNGATSLQPDGEPAIQGDAAEQKLAELLKVDKSIGGGGAKKALADRWAHLWVWQGASDTSPADTVTEAQSSLRSRLQSQAGGGLMVSSTDGQLIANLQRSVDESFTSKGKAKAGSHLATLEQRVESIAADVAEKRQRFDELTRASDLYAAATEDVDRHSSTANRTTDELDHVEKLLEKVAVANDALKEKRVLREQAQSQLDTLKMSDHRIRSLEKNEQSAVAAGEPLKNKFDQITREQSDTRKLMEVADNDVRSLATAANNARMRADACDFHHRALVRTIELAAHRKKQSQVTELETRRRTTADTVAKLAAFTADAVKSLRSKQRQVEATTARLEATAMKLEVVATDSTVTIDGTPLATGESRTLDHPGELAIGDATRIQLTPGGADDLTNARSAQSDATRQFTSLMKKLGAKTLDDAEERTHSRTRAAHELKSIDDQLTALDSSGLPKVIASIEEELTSLTTMRDTHAAGVEGIEFTNDVDEAKSATTEAAKASQNATAKAKDAASTKESRQHQLDQLTTTLEKAREGYQASADKTRDIQTELKLLRDQHGDSESRTAGLVKLESTFEQAKSAEAHQQSALNELGPDRLAANKRRLSQVLDNSRTAATAARERQISAKTLLETNGTTDPQRELAEAEAEQSRVTTRLETAQRDANAKRFLLDRLKDAQRRTSEALAKPLEDAASGYLEYLFGSGTRARVTWSDDSTAINGITIDRTPSGHGTFDFNQLSHGTREQVALALRLAMACVLATDHDGALPVVLDDAFTHADRERIRMLQGVLFHGVEQGLQIIVLTCHPENYSGLASNEVALSRG